MTLHRGHIVEIAVRSSGKPIAEISEKLGITRSTLYKKFEKSFIDDSFMIELSKVVDYDLGGLLPDLKYKLEEKLSFKDIDGEYIIEPRTLSEQAFMYEDLLDQYRILLIILLKLSTENIPDIVRLKIYNFISEFQKQNNLINKENDFKAEEEVVY